MTYPVRTPSDQLIRREVYFIKSGDLIKIGCSANISKRMADIQTWSPYKLELLAIMPGNVRVENALHSYFEDEWSHAEWFHPSARLLEMIDQIKNGDVPEISEGPITAYRKQVVESRRSFAALPEMDLERGRAS